MKLSVKRKEEKGIVLVNSHLRDILSFRFAYGAKRNERGINGLADVMLLSIPFWIVRQHAYTISLKNLAN